MREAAVELLALLRERLDRSGTDLIVSRGPDELGVRMEIPNGSPSLIDRMVVDMGHLGDIDVEVHVPERRHSPFTQHFPWSGDPELLSAVATFVSEFVEEATVLAHRPGPIRGGRAFVAPERLDGPDGGDCEWAVSWKGTRRLP